MANKKIHTIRIKNVKSGVILTRAFENPIVRRNVYDMLVFARNKDIDIEIEDVEYVSAKK